MKPTLVLSAAVTLALVLVLALGLIRYSSPPPSPTASESASNPPGDLTSLTSDRIPTDAVQRQNWRLARPTAESDRDGGEPVDGTTPPATNWLEELFTHNGPQPLSQEVIDSWFASGRTNAGDLLAARQAGGGIEFLEKALETFPNDPRVLLAATATARTDPEVQRERLERFKAAAPDNALANYLSALHEFRAGEPEKAVAELMAASQKKGFDDYILDAMQTTEELYLHAGKSQAEAKATAMSSTALPHLVELKRLATSLAELQGQYIATGDGASAERLAQMGIGLGEHLLEGPGSRTRIANLVGFAIDKIVVSGLPAGTDYAFLNGDVGQYLAGIAERRALSTENVKSGDTLIRAANEAQLMEYFDRLKGEGEVQAAKWLRLQVEGETPKP